MGIAIVVVIIAVIIVLSIGYNTSMPVWAKEPCSKCGSAVMRWLKKQDTRETGEAKFCCKACGHKEYRGGEVGELSMQLWEAKK